MTRKISLIVLAVVMAVSVLTVSAFAETELPPYDSRVMTAAELDAFFDDGNAEYLGDLVGSVYDALEDKDEVFGMVYSAVEDYATAVTKPYANYVVDFELTSKSDVSVLLVGNYGEYHTIPLGIVNLEAGVPVNIMETASKLTVNGNALTAWSSFTYSEVVLLVKEFKCAAIPLTEDVLRAFHKVAIGGEYDEEATLANLLEIANPTGATEFEKTETSAPLSISLDLYESEKVGNLYVRNDVKYDVTEPEEFTYYPELPPYEARELTDSELAAFFADGNTQYMGDLVGAVYNALENKEEIFGMTYKAVEDYATAVNAPYANYIVDFSLTADEDMSVLLVGNYGAYHTIPLGVVNLEAGVPVNIMETASKLTVNGNSLAAWSRFTYAEIVLLVKEFKCAALPLTEDVLRAYHQVAIGGEYDEEATLANLLEIANPTGAVTFEKVTEANGLGLCLDLYETEMVGTTPVKTGTVHQVTEETEFTVYPTLPLYNSKNLTKEELDVFFNDPNLEYNGDIVRDIYAKLYNPTESVFGMNFQSVEDYATAVNAPYANYIPDFLLSSDKDVSVILMGNYGDWNTIPLGIVNLKAGTPERIVKLTQQLKPDWTCDYLDAVLMVKNFDGVAMVLSSDVLRAMYRVKCEQDAAYQLANPSFTPEVEARILEALADNERLNPYGAESFAVAGEDVVLNLSVKLYENVEGQRYAETGESWVVNDGDDFAYEGDARPDIMQKLLIVNNMSATEGNNRLHVCAAVDSLNFKEVGFLVTVVDMAGNYQTQTKRLTTDTVYGSMKVTNAAGTSETTYTAAQLGGQYMFGGEILLDSAVYTNTNTKIIITPYAIDRDGKEILGKETTMTDAIIKNRTATSALFRY